MLTAEELAVIFAQERYVLRGREVDAALAAFDAVHGGNYDTVHDLSPRAAFERALTGASGHTDHLTAAVKHMAANETSTALARADAVVHAAKALDRAYDAAADAKTDDDHADSAAAVSRRATDLSAALAAYDGPAVRDCAKLGHRYATRQTTGEETCIDCFGVEPASEAKWRPSRDLELESTKDALTETLKSRAEARAALAASEAARAEAERKMEAWSKWATAPRAEAAAEIARLIEASRESEHAAHMEIERLSAEALVLRMQLSLAERDLKAVSSGIETEEDVAMVAAEEGVLLADNARLKDSLLAAREELRKLALMVERDIHGGGVKVATQAAVQDILGRPENDGPVTGYVRRLLTARLGDKPVADDPYWDRAKEISAEVATWPAWKRADLGRLIEGPK